MAKPRYGHYDPMRGVYVVDKPKPQTKPKPKPKPKPYEPPVSDVRSTGGYKPPSRKQQDLNPPAPPNPQPQQDNQPPHPALVKVGINRSLEQFNHLIDVINNTFVGRYGYQPSPGLVYDFARSPQVNLFNVEHLLKVPQSHTAAHAQGLNAKVRRDQPEGYFHLRADGRLDQADPLDRIGFGSASGLNQGSVLGEVAGVAGNIENALLNPVGAAAQAVGGLVGGGGQQAQQPLRAPSLPNKKYPWVSQAGLPIPGAGQFWDAITTVWNTKLSPDESRLVRQGQTLSDYEYHLKQAEMVPAQQKYAKLRGAVTTVKAGQQALQQMAPDYFKNLPVDGYFNTDWANALKLYKKSTLGAQQQTEYDAKKAGLSVHDYVQAWRNKERILRQHPQYYQMVAPMDLKLLVHPDSLSGSASDLAKYLVSGIDWGAASTYLLPILPYTKVVGNTAKLGMNLIGGSLDQYKAYATAMRVVMQHGAKTFSSDSKTKDEMYAELKKALIEKPTYAKMLGLHVPTWADQVTNLAGDLILFGKVKFTGEYVARGDFIKAANSKYLNSASDLAWRQVKKHGMTDIARAAQFLESESSFGAERLMAATAKDIVSGKLSKARFQSLVALGYSQGEVTYGKTRILMGDVLQSLSTKDLATKNPGWQNIKSAFRGASDAVDRRLRASDLPGTNSANTFLNLLRNELGHASPKGEFRNFYEPRLPQRIFDYTKATFKDPQKAKEWENAFVVARARGDEPAMARVFDQISEHYHSVYKTKNTGQPEEPFKALFLTESPVRGYFPAGGQKELDGIFGALSNYTHDVNDWALKVTGWHRRIIVGGNPVPVTGFTGPPFGFSLMEKHAVADTTRRLVGGGFTLKGDKRALKEIEAFVQEPGNERFLRILKNTEARSRDSETRYYLRGSRADALSFNTAEKFGSARHMEAAGGYLRRIFSDDAINALSQSNSRNLDPLVSLIEKNKDYRGIALSRSDYLEEAKQALRALKQRANPPATREIKQAKLAELREGIYRDQAKAMYNRYQHLVDAAQAAGIEDPVGAIRQIIHSTKGSKIDVALGKWVKDNHVQFDVRKGLVPEGGGQLSDWQQRYIGFLMGPNKWNRSGMFKTVMAKTYGTLRDAGWSKDAAFESAATLAERQTYYHMLDFANMLKVEQDLRWASYFATKHRLYWKWVLGQTLRRPVVAIAAHDMQNSLDSRGNLNFKMFGQSFAIPFPRLMWLNTLELPEISSPLAGAQGFVQGVVKGKNPFYSIWANATATSGNIFTRDDQAWIAAWHLARSPRTYEGATGGMSPTQKATFNREVNHFQTQYKLDHGHYAPEKEAVTYALWLSLGHEAVRANFVVPTWNTGQSEKTYNAQQRLWNKYSRITDTQKRREFLDKHPDLVNQISDKKDPAVYQHNQQFFARFRALQKTRSDARQHIWEKALYNGWTPELESQWRKVGQAFNNEMSKLELADAKTWAGSPSYPAGKVEEGQVVRPGPFGIALQGNPGLARKELIHIFPGIKPKDLKAHTVGQTIEVLQAERDFLHTPAGKKTYADPQAWRDRLAELNKRLSVFQSYPKTAPERAHARFFDIVNAYRDKRDAWRTRITNMPSDRQERAYAELRAWEDSQDHPVSVRVGERTIRFPSPARIGFETATPDERRATMVRWATDNWNHLSNFAKHKLSGQHIDPTVSRGQLLLQLILSSAKADKAARDRLIKEYNINVPALPPGESIDTEQRAAIVTQVDKIVGAKGKFIKDYNFANQPTVARLRTYEFVKRDPNWQDLFDQVDYFLSAARKAGYTGRERTITDIYRTQIVPQLKARVATEGARFRNEIGFFVKQDPNFWNRLIAP